MAESMVLGCDCGWRDRLKNIGDDGRNVLRRYDGQRQIQSAPSRQFAKEIGGMASGAEALLKEPELRRGYKPRPSGSGAFEKSIRVRIPLSRQCRLSLANS